MKSMSMSWIWFHVRRSADDMLGDCSGIAATEFAVIAPLMLVLFFGTVEFSTGVAVDRKVTLIARTLSDLTSQSPPPNPQSVLATVGDNDLQNIFTASIAILSSYSPTPTQATISEIYIDSHGKATIQWSKAAVIAAGATQATLTNSSHSPQDVVTPLVPPKLLLATQTYLILSEVSYLYKPTIGYVMANTGVTLSDKAYTRPRQVVCMVYITPSPPQPNDSGSPPQPACPTPP
jgi:Flp pilus assembly protein TadG